MDRKEMLRVTLAGKGWSLRPQFKLQDMWFGIYWKLNDWWKPGPGRGAERRELQVWVCLVPMFPIYFRWTWVREIVKRQVGA